MSKLRRTPLLMPRTAALAPMRVLCERKLVLAAAVPRTRAATQRVLDAVSWA